MATCSVDGCGGEVRARGWCIKHYTRWSKYGDPLVVLRDKAENGALQAFIEMALNHQDDKECLYWPFAKDKDGYAVKTYRDTRESSHVHRVICKAVNGPPPSPKHETAHNCGRGHLGCVNPHHLRWDTKTGNEADKIIHGTHNRGEQAGLAKLTQEQVQEIRFMQGKLPGYKVGGIFNVSRSTVYAIWSGRTWKE